MRCDAPLGRCRALSHDLRRLLCRSMQPRRSRPRHRGAHDAMPYASMHARLSPCGGSTTAHSEHQARHRCLSQVFEWAELAAADVSAAVRFGGSRKLAATCWTTCNAQHATCNMQRATCFAVAEACVLCTARTDRMRGYALGKHSERSLTRRLCVGKCSARGALRSTTDQWHTV